MRHGEKAQRSVLPAYFDRAAAVGQAFADVGVKILLLHVEGFRVGAPGLVHLPQIARRAGDEGQIEIAAPPVVQKSLPRGFVEIDHPPFDGRGKRFAVRRKGAPHGLPSALRPYPFGSIHQRQGAQEAGEFFNAAVFDFSRQGFVLFVAVFAVARQDHKTPVVALNGDGTLVVGKDDEGIEVVMPFRIAPFALHHNHIRRDHVFQLADNVQPLVRRADFLEYRYQRKQQRGIEARFQRVLVELAQVIAEQPLHHFFAEGRFAHPLRFGNEYQRGSGLFMRPSETAGQPVQHPFRAIRAQIAVARAQMPDQADNVAAFREMADQLLQRHIGRHLDIRLFGLHGQAGKHIDVSDLPLFFIHHHAAGHRRVEHVVLHRADQPPGRFAPVFEFFRYRGLHGGQRDDALQMTVESVRRPVQINIAVQRILEIVADDGHRLQLFLLNQDGRLQFRQRLPFGKTQPRRHQRPRKHLFQLAAAESLPRMQVQRFLLQPDLRVVFQQIR